MTVRHIIDYYPAVVEPILRDTLAAYQDLSILAANLPPNTLNDAVFPRARRPERPTLVYIGWLLAGGRASSDVPAKAAVALEFAHSGGLIHDDIVDAALQRNWLPTVWADYSARHADSRLGRNIALWLGDLLFYWAHDIFGNALAEVHSDAQVAARRIWTHGFTALIGSQHSDLNGFALKHTHETALQAAKEVARLKGVFVATLPLQLGAALAGGSPDLLTAVQAYGEPLGEAYVYRNDLEGVFGVVGTTDYVPDDLRQQRLSTLLALAHSRSTPAQTKLLERAGGHCLTDNDVDKIKAIIDGTGARREVEKLAERLINEAKDASRHHLILAWARPHLTNIAEKAMAFHKIPR